jgi:hypothetical protein
MRSLDFPALVPGLVVFLLSIGFYALVAFALWKFYQIFSKINENIAAIRQVLHANRLDAAKKAQEPPLTK